ncbi:hypothetical protein K437DRAFT_292788 [Tilletiaria anomala UBC 951]|uniref:Uncharacterized protein n=1 Tax=Tilletiaria anomala (strain ATCC 24038 / CBS 436.72 / UBC 951) TaxID=1037660 RepID=A0A066WGJ9_TILAU|nr:uncharacterized protein K437DRAFT_292788 [Tilletiaria anomala UBC 951]KDN52896.1 hypothetical protein K437DRAFT_292788 [Tilletiaria anomala UBC 951]
MYCLRWWVPIFLLPFPSAPPVVLVFFLTAYGYQTRPCIYCAAILVGLFFSTCYWDTAAAGLTSSDASAAGAAATGIGTITKSLRSAAVTRDFEKDVPGAMKTAIGKGLFKEESSGWLQKLWANARVDGKASGSHKYDTTSPSEPALGSTSVAEPLLFQSEESNPDPAASESYPSDRRSEEQVCNCWLTFGPKGRGFKGFFQPVPRRRNGSMAMHPTASAAVGIIEDVAKRTTTKLGLMKKGGLGEKGWFRKSSKHDQRGIWFGIPDSSFGVYVTFP